MSPARAEATFDAGGLRLREPFDARARDAAAPALDLPALAARRAADGLLHVLDLGAGTGANLRWLAPRLGGRQQWVLVDHDAQLREPTREALQAWAVATGRRWRGGRGDVVGELAGPDLAVRVEWEAADLAHDAERLPWRASGLVTASALLDLVSAPVLRRLLDHAAAARCAMLWALNVDGARRWHPPDADDAIVADAFERHQRRDKGAGEALGPRAAAFACDRLAAAGYRVGTARSDWALDGARSAADAALLRALVEGDAAAAIAQAREAGAGPQAERITRWRDRRLATLPALRATIGHVDIAATPPER